MWNADPSHTGPRLQSKETQNTKLFGAIAMGPFREKNRHSDAPPPPQVEHPDTCLRGGQLPGATDAPTTERGPTHRPLDSPAGQLVPRTPPVPSSGGAELLKGALTSSVHTVGSAWDTPVHDAHFRKILQPVQHPMAHSQ